MKILPPYKHFIAGLLLLLYTFIAMPVQCWHHHNSSAIKKTVSTKKQQKSFEKNYSQTSEKDCSICSHQYSVYNEPSIGNIKFASLLLNNIHNSFTVSISEISFLRFSNRGPPVTA